MIRSAENNRLKDIGAELLRDEPAFQTSQEFGSFVRQGAGNGPSVLIGDQSTIELYPGNTTSMLDHRMALLAKSGDVVVVRHRSSAFEAYLERYLGASGVTFLESVAANPSPIAQQCRTLPYLRDTLQSCHSAANMLTLCSYLTSGHDWRLAASLGERTGVPVHVFGPAPRIGRRTNDKLWFWRLARKVLGTDRVPPTLHAFGPAAAAAQVVRLQATGLDVVVKLPSSAGGAGNLRLSAELLDGLSLKQIRDLIVGRLRATGWSGHYPILVGVWECGVTNSPSAQVFVPLIEDGSPIVEGLFEQHVVGEEGEFVGAVPSTLPQAIRDTMHQEAIALASVLQSLGYFGWCSFDAILRDDGTLHWIECNGRWSGVSIPFSASRKLIGHTPGGIAIAQDHLERRALRFNALIDRLDDLLLGKRQRREGLILTSPQDNTTTTLNFHAVAVADDQLTAETLLKKARNRLR